MIELCKNWCESIIVAVVISIIIEAILPEGNNKKYVKVVIGIFIIYTILNPIFSKMDTQIDFSNFDYKTSIATSSIDVSNIQQLYASGIEETMKNNIEENFNCYIDKVNVIYDNNYENIEQVNLKINFEKINQIEKIEIGNQNKSETKEENINYNEIKKYISENYNIEQDKIYIN